MIVKTTLKTLLYAAGMRVSWNETPKPFVHAIVCMINTRLHTTSKTKKILGTSQASKIPNGQANRRDEREIYIYIYR